MSKKRIYVWGDSIAKGVIMDEALGRYRVLKESCVARLERESDAEVHNFAVMGNTSAQGLERMRAGMPDDGGVAVIEFGGNDCDLDWRAASERPELPQQGKVPLEAFGENLRRMLACAREAGMDPVLVTPPPLVAKRYFDWVSRNLNPARILEYLGDVEHIYRWQERYALMIRNVAREENVRLLDVRDAFLAQPRMTDMICIDGIHPNERGHAMLFDMLSAAI